MKWLIALLLVMLILLQYRIWVGDGSLAEVHRLDLELAQQDEKNKLLRERNLALEGEVKDLKQGLDSIEERARSELGMTHKDETFYQVIEE